MTQYIFDVTALRPYIAHHNKLSGIQRVSVMAMDSVRQKIEAGKVWFGFLDHQSGCYKVVQCSSDPEIDITNHSYLCNLLKVNVSRNSLPAMEKYARRPFKKRIVILRRDLYARFGNKKYFDRFGISSAQWREARSNQRVKKESYPNHLHIRDVAKSGDQLIILDNAWFPSGLSDVLCAIKQDIKLEITVMIHDLIPIVRPEYTEADIPKKLYKWLLKSEDFVTQFIANSKSTAVDLREFLLENNIKIPIKVVSLAQNTLLREVSDISLQDEKAPSKLESATKVPDIIRALTKRSYVLIVGTQEIRKNLWSVATVWDRLRHERGRDLPKLVIAGRRGWLNTDFENLMSATGNLGGWVEVIDGPSDDIIDYLYRNCLFTITASFYEGWGLPIGESLAYGKTAVVSETSSMPEVGQNFVVYCDPKSIDDIERACLRLIDDPFYRMELEARIGEAKLRSWNDVAKDILDILPSASVRH